MSTTDDRVIERDVPLDLIDPPEQQHRVTLEPAELGRLADSLNELGLLQSIGVVATAYGDRFRVCWGWRRLNAARLAHWTHIRARVFPYGYDADRARAAENEFRTDLNPLERAEVCRRWLEQGMALVEIARRWRREPETVRGWLALLELPEDLREAVSAGQIAAGVARELAVVDFAEYRKGLLDEAIRSGATVRVVTAWTAAYGADRERIVANTITVGEILQAAHHYVLKLVCEVCGLEVPLEGSRTIRCCAACYAIAGEALRSTEPAG